MTCHLEIEAQKTSSENGRKKEKSKASPLGVFAPSWGGGGKGEGLREETGVEFRGGGQNDLDSQEPLKKKTLHEKKIRGGHNRAYTRRGGKMEY